MFQLPLQGEITTYTTAMCSEERPIHFHLHYGMVKLVSISELNEFFKRNIKNKQ